MLVQIGWRLFGAILWFSTEEQSRISIHSVFAVESKGERDMRRVKTPAAIMFKAGVRRLALQIPSVGYRPKPYMANSGERPVRFV